MIQLIYYILFVITLLYGLYFAITGLFAFKKDEDHKIRPKRARRRVVPTRRMPAAAQAPLATGRHPPARTTAASISPASRRPTAAAARPSAAQTRRSVGARFLPCYPYSHPYHVPIYSLSLWHFTPSTCLIERCESSCKVSAESKLTWILPNRRRTSASDSELVWAF